MGTIMVFALLCRKKTMMTLFAAGQESLFNTVRNFFLSFLLLINALFYLINNPTKSKCNHSAIHGQTIGPIEKFISLKFLKFL